MVSLTSPSDAVTAAAAKGHAVVDSKRPTGCREGCSLVICDAQLRCTGVPDYECTVCRK